MEKPEKGKSKSKQRREFKFVEIHKAPQNWKELMSREVKRFRNKWNTDKKPYTPTPPRDSNKNKEK